MQTWSRQTECVFCLFRNELRRPYPTTRSRAYHISPPLLVQSLSGRQTNREQYASDRPRTSSRRDRFEERGREAVSNLRRPGARRVKLTEQDDENKEVKVQDRVKDRLGGHRRMLKIPVDVLSPEVRYLKKADPDGISWDSFEDLVTQTLAGKKSALRNEHSFSLMSQLESAALTEGWRDEIDRVLRFGFLDHILSDGESTLSNTLPAADLKYPTEWYQHARAMQREIHLHVGPTNSGKTYTALKKLEEAQDGFYAGPLRLLAHEVYSRFNNRGIACDLVTGDDIRLNEAQQVKLYASTVEMVDIGKTSRVGVIDEIQMMGSEDRGWAWTRAVLGARVQELHLCGEARVVPLIRELVASMGDTLHIHQYNRLNPLKVMSRSLKGNLNNLRKGDCVVSFSVVGIHALRKQIELETGKRVAIVYGSLPPETRAKQAALFNDPDNDYDYLVASDAIGMGLNLSVKRIVFETTMKWNGSFNERLSISQLKQIAGRAGRYKTAQDDKAPKSGEAQKSTANVGLVTCLDEADLPSIQAALASEAPPLRAAGLLPPGEVFEDFAARLPEGTPFEYVMKRVLESASLNKRFTLCTTKDQYAVARLLDPISDLPLRDRLVFCASPASLRGRNAGRQDQIVTAMARAVASNQSVTVVDLSEIPLEALDDPPSSDRSYLEALEILHKSLILYLWLSYRFQHIFRDQDMAIHAKNLTEEKINQTLVNYSANPKLRQRLLQIKKTSAILRDQASARAEVSMPMTMNPDASVEEIERQALEEKEEGNMTESGEAEETAGKGEGEKLDLKEEHDDAFDWAGGAVEQNLQPDEQDVVDEEVQKKAASFQG